MTQTGAGYQWLNGSTIIPFANTTTYHATVSGFYRVITNRCGVDSVSEPFPVAIGNPSPSFTYTNAGLSYSFVNNSTNNIYRWRFSDGSPDQTTVNAVHTFASSGIYTVTLIETSSTTNCRDSILQTINTSLGISSLPADRLYSIYPNPATSEIFLKTNLVVRILVTDITGRTLTIPIYKTLDHYRVDVSLLAEGVYLLHIITALGHTEEKILIAP